MIFLFIGLAIGCVIGWLFAIKKSSQSNIQAGNNIAGLEKLLEELRKQIEEKNRALTEALANSQNLQELKVRAETQLSETVKNYNEQKKILEEAAQRLKEAFSSLSADALKSNNSAFLELAQSSLEKYIVDAKSDLDKRQNMIDLTVKPLADVLQEYKKGLNDAESSRQKAYGELKTQIEGLQRFEGQLQKETNALVAALKTTQMRGRYGEIGLRRVVEFAGMSEFCDFSEQVSQSTDNGKIRPDLIVNLPGNRKVIIDSKVPLTAYLNAFEAVDDIQKKQFFLKHAKDVRSHMDQLGSKEYWKQFKGITPDFVVLYMQIEPSFGAALENDKTLLEDGFAKQVFFATPTTLITLLRTVAYTWQQEKVTENSRKIYNVGIELYEKISIILEYIGDIKKGLESAVAGYNKAIGSIESRFMPSIRKLRELTPPVNELPDNGIIEIAARDIPSI